MLYLCQIYFEKWAHMNANDGAKRFKFIETQWIYLIFRRFSNEE